MKVDHIYKLNESISTLRNFINLSAKLLPYLIELKHSKRKEDGRTQREKIMAEHKEKR